NSSHLVCRFWSNIPSCYVAALCDLLLADCWCGYLGRQHPDRLGICDYQLRMVDRYWSCWNSNFSNTSSSSSRMADLYQQICRSDDIVCRHVCRALSIATSWQAMVLLLALSISKYNGDMAAIPQPACL